MEIEPISRVILHVIWAFSIIWNSKNLDFQKKYNWTNKLGVPTFKIFLSEQAGGYIFCTVFHKDLKNVNLFKIGSLSKN